MRKQKAGLEYDMGLSNCVTRGAEAWHVGALLRILTHREASAKMALKTRSPEQTQRSGTPSLRPGVHTWSVPRPDDPRARAEMPRREPAESRALHESPWTLLMTHKAKVTFQNSPDLTKPSAGPGN